MVRSQPRSAALLSKQLHTEYCLFSGDHNSAARQGSNRSQRPHANVHIMQQLQGTHRSLWKDLRHKGRTPATECSRICLRSGTTTRLIVTPHALKQSQGRTRRDLPREDRRSLCSGFLAARRDGSQARPDQYFPPPRSHYPVLPPSDRFAP